MFSGSPSSGHPFLHHARFCISSCRKKPPSSPHWSNPSNHRRTGTCHDASSRHSLQLFNNDHFMSFDSRTYWVFLQLFQVRIISIYINTLIFSSKDHEISTLNGALTWCCWSCHWWAWSPRPGSPPWYARRSSAERCWVLSFQGLGEGLGESTGESKSMVRCIVMVVMVNSWI